MRELQNEITAAALEGTQKQIFMEKARTETSIINAQRELLEKKTGLSEWEALKWKEYADTLAQEKNKAEYSGELGAKAFEEFKKRKESETLKAIDEKKKEFDDFETKTNQMVDLLNMMTEVHIDGIKKAKGEKKSAHEEAVKQIQEETGYLKTLISTGVSAAARPGVLISRERAVETPEERARREQLGGVVTTSLERVGIETQQAVADVGTIVAKTVTQTMETTMLPTLRSIGDALKGVTAQRGIPYVPRTGLYKLEEGERVLRRGAPEMAQGAKPITIINLIKEDMLNEFLLRNPDAIVNIVGADLVGHGITRKLIKGVT